MQIVQAIRVCYDPTASSISDDPNPALNKECYFDYAVTGSAVAASAASEARAEFSSTRTVLGKLIINSNKIDKTIPSNL